MLEKQDQELIVLFINNQLKNNKTFKIKTFANIDEILTNIQLYSQFKNYTKVQILQKLIFNTSYNLPFICSRLLSIYRQQYFSADTICNMYQIFANLYYHFLHNDDYQESFILDYLLFVEKFYPIKRSSRPIPKSYHLLKNNNTYEVKNIFVHSHKVFNALSLKTRCGIYGPELILALYHIFNKDFYFSQKEKRTFINIFADILMKTFIAYQNYKGKTDERPWIQFFDFLFSNWFLLQEKYKLFLKKDGKQCIQLFFSFDEYDEDDEYDRENRKERNNIVKIFHKIINNVLHGEEENRQIDTEEDELIDYNFELNLPCDEKL